MTTKKSYKAHAFRQRADAPLQVAFIAPSCEIASWARVPTKRTGNVRNFQRAELPKHITEVQKFFENDDNCSPTAVVVGFDPIRSQGKVLIKTNGNLLDPNIISPDTPVLCDIEIEWIQDDPPSHRDELISSTLAERSTLQGFIFKELMDVTKLSNDVLSELLEFFDSRTQDEFESSQAHDEEDEQTTGSEVESSLYDFPEHIKNNLAGLSPSASQVIYGRMEFLSQIQASNMESWTDDDIRSLYEEIQAELKPGILIDGQHRISGTKELGRIPFLVTALPDAAWPELAFQFIVTNRTARRVPESLLISIIGNSLSQDQRDQIEGRLRQANIRVGLIEAVMQIHEDEQSPFYGMLEFGIKGEAGFLDAAAMRSKVIQCWYERKNPVKQLFDHLCEGRSVTERTEFWKSEDKWFEYLVAFWTAVKERYEGSEIFTNELIEGESKKVSVSKLMTATVLKIFQETILDGTFKYLKQKQQKELVPLSESLPNADSFQEYINRSLQPLTPAFFTGWNITGFDGSKGARDDLSEAIKAVVFDDKKVAALKNARNPHRLFKEKVN